MRSIATAIVLSTVAVVGCASAEQGAVKGANAPGIKAARRADGTVIDDRAMCDFKGRKDVEVSETAGPGAVFVNVRRVWKVFGTGPDRRKILICREVDSNLDGIKDTVRFYNEDGQSKEERSDTNSDGKIDTWNVFAKGRLAEVRLDHNHDGEPDEWKIFIDGLLSRAKRDRDFDGKIDVWEMYRNGRLERMGVDLTGDERVDRWDHDTEWRRKHEEAEKAKAEQDERKRKEDAERRRLEAEKAAAEPK